DVLQYQLEAERTPRSGRRGNQQSHGHEAIAEPAGDVLKGVLAAVLRLPPAAQRLGVVGDVQVLRVQLLPLADRLPDRGTGRGAARLAGVTGGGAAAPPPEGGEGACRLAPRQLGSGAPAGRGVGPGVVGRGEKRFGGRAGGGELRPAVGARRRELEAAGLAGE